MIAIRGLGIVPFAASALFLLAGMVQAQEHPFLSAYLLTEFDAGVRVTWTMAGGSTCNGLEVQRSLDGSSFITVHEIPGLCGDPAFAVDYAWLDRSPPELSTVFYRLKIGAADFSSIKPIAVTRLYTSDQRSFPSPASSTWTLILNVPSSASIDLAITDQAGRSTIRHSGLPAPRVDLDLARFAPGAYTYWAVSDGRTFIGRFVKE